MKIYFVSTHTVVSVVKDLWNFKPSVIQYSNVKREILFFSSVLHSTHYTSVTKCVEIFPTPSLIL